MLHQNGAILHFLTLLFAPLSNFGQIRDKSNRKVLILTSNRNNDRKLRNSAGYQDYLIPLSDDDTLRDPVHLIRVNLDKIHIFKNLKHAAKHHFTYTSFQFALADEIY